MADNFRNFKAHLDTPNYGNAAAVTPHNTNELAKATRAVWVGGAGNLKVTMVSGEEVTFNSVPAGTELRIRAKIIWATGTTATNIVALS